VGAYTAAAVAAIAFGQAATVVDGNIERVMARLFAVTDALPGAKPHLRALAAQFTGADRPGDFAQALMDLGATVCTPKSPQCGACPLAGACRGLALGDPATLPRKAPKAEKTMRHGVAFFLVRASEVFLVRRPEKGLLAGMPALPTSAWTAMTWTPQRRPPEAPIKTDWRDAGAIAHVFTHFPLTLHVLVGRTEAAPVEPGWWAPLHADHALPTVFQKAYERGLSALTGQP
jgi:A/G-specific adenine glycosylase